MKLKNVASALLLVAVIATQPAWAAWRIPFIDPQTGNNVAATLWLQYLQASQNGSLHDTGCLETADLLVRAYATAMRSDDCFKKNFRNWEDLAYQLFQRYAIAGPRNAPGYFEISAVGGDDYGAYIEYLSYSDGLLGGVRANSSVVKAVHIVGRDNQKVIRRIYQRGLSSDSRPGDTLERRVEREVFKGYLVMHALMDGAAENYNRRLPGVCGYGRMGQEAMMVAQAYWWEPTPYTTSPVFVGPGMQATVGPSYPSWIDLKTDQSRLPPRRTKKAPPACFNNVEVLTAESFY